MRNLLTIFTLVFTLMFSSPSYAEWTKVGEGVKGNTFYVDFERIRKDLSYVYWWELSDYKKPTTDYSKVTEVISVFSDKTYQQGDCELFRYKSLSVSLHKEPMGGGTGRVDNKPDIYWTYPTPDSVSETILKEVCSRSEKIRLVPTH